ncbi:MAG: hypothetical protein GY730_02795 [bacterium]|nr:hypothetical protein [bacterium]
MKIKNIYFTSIVVWIMYLIMGTIVQVLTKDLFSGYSKELAILFKPEMLKPALTTTSLLFLLYFVFVVAIVYIYALLRTAVPGKTNIQKGLTFTMIVWMLFILMPNIKRIVFYNILEQFFFINSFIELISFIPGGMVAVVCYEYLLAKGK